MDDKRLYSIRIRGVRYFVITSISDGDADKLKEYCDELSQTPYAYSRQEELNMVLGYIRGNLCKYAVELPVTNSFDIY